jgi:excisionase family DNA binding protein
VSGALRVRPVPRLIPSTAEFLTVEEFAAILRLPSSTAYGLARKGVVPTVKLGRHRRIRREFVDMLGRDAPPARSELPVSPVANGVPTRPDWLTVEEVATLLRQPLSTTYEQVRLGRILSVKLGKHRRVRRSVIDNLGR